MRGVTPGQQISTRCQEIGQGLASVASCARTPAKAALLHTGLLLANSLLVLRQSCRPGGSYIDRTQRNFGTGRAAIGQEIRTSASINSADRTIRRA